MVGGAKWAARQQMFEIRQDQFLVLPLVLESEFDDTGKHLGERIGTQQPEDLAVDVRPILEHLFESK